MWWCHPAMTRKTVRITRRNRVILFSEIGPGRMPFRQRKIAKDDLAGALADAGMNQPDAEKALAEFRAKSVIVASFIPNGPLHHRS